MNALKFGIAVITFAIFVSCDCLQHVQGTVIDSGTRQPIKEVIIKKDTGLVIYTDSVGNFDITTMTGGSLMHHIELVALFFSTSSGADRRHHHRMATIFDAESRLPILPPISP